MPNGVLSGTPPIKQDAVNDEISLDKVITTAKNFKLIDESPATKHSKSSGKNGKINIAASKVLSLPLILDANFSSPSPARKFTAFRPKFLPM